MQHTPCRTFFLNNQNQQLILRFEMNLLLNILVLSYKVYRLKQKSIAHIIEDTLKNNPETDIIRDNKVGTQLLYTSPTFNLNQVNEELIKLNSIQGTTENELIKVETFGSRFFFPPNSFSLYKSFLQGFITNYDQIKIGLLNPVVEKEQEQQENNQQEIVIQTDINKDILKEILNLSPSPIVNYYIIKWINKNNTNDKSIELKKDELKLQRLFDFELFSFNKNNFKSLEEIINFSQDNREELVTKIRSLFRYFHTVVNDTDLNNIEKTVYLQIILFLMFVYGYRLFHPNVNLQDYDLEEAYTKIVNTCISKIIEKDRNLNPINIIFFDSENRDNQLELDKLNEISQKYKYLIKIDEDIFLDRVFSDFEEEDGYEEDAQRRVNPKIFINEPKLINIKEFIDKGTEGMLSYETIPDNTHKIISKEYKDILLVENGESIRKPHPIISRFSDIIINHIFDKIKQKKELAEWSNINTLILMEEFIEPFMVDSSEFEKRFILYKVLIPHLYNLFQTETVIDYFH